jgi:hypothetical protein
MELTVADKVIANPTAAEIEAAFASPAYNGDWYITLDTETGAMLDALYQPDGRFELRHFDNERKRSAVPNVDAATLKTILLQFLAGDQRWHEHCRWESEADAKARQKAEAAKQIEQARAAALAVPPAPLWQRLIGFAVVIASVYVGYSVWSQGLGFITGPFPQAQPELVLMTGGMGAAALLLFIATHNYSKQAQNWPFVTGKVTINDIESYWDNSGGRSTRFYRPVIEFSYSVNGVTYKSRQRQLGATMSGSESWARKVMAKYPVGASVAVHYEPANPANAALENPTGLTWIAFGVAVFCAAVCVYALGVFR